METFSPLLALCEENPSITSGFPSQRSITQSFVVFFDLHLNTLLRKQSRCQWYEMPSCSLWHHCNLKKKSVKKPYQNRRKYQADSFIPPLNFIFDNSHIPIVLNFPLLRVPIYRDTHTYCNLMLSRNFHLEFPLIWHTKPAIPDSQFLKWLADLPEDTFTMFELQTWLPDFILGINPFGIFLAWPVCPDVTSDIRNNTVVSSLSIDRKLEISLHDDIIKWKHFPRYWPFVQGNHWSPHKGQ